MRWLATLVVVSAFLVGVAHSATLPWVTIGDAGNAPDSSMFGGSFGAVDYVYRIGKYEVINDQYPEFLNAVARADPHDLYHPNMDVANDVHGGIQRNSGEAGFTYFAQPGRENKPVTYIDFLDTVRFANWLHNDQPSGPQTASTTEDGAYTIVPSATEIIRNPTAKFFLPSDAEWYKAAYNPGGDLDAG
jgi:sulfatase modifying factor 1